MLQKTTMNKSKKILPKKQGVYVKKFSITQTLLSLRKGQSAFISIKDCKTNSVRAAISRMNKEGYSFKASERGLSDGIIVNRE